MSAELLKERDYTIIIAKNATQQGSSPPGLQQQWELAEKSMINLAKKCEGFDPDGISVYVASTPFQKYQRVNSEVLEKLFQQDYTAKNLNLLEVLTRVINDYFQVREEGKQKTNGEMIIVVLDSEPEHRRGIIKLLVEVTKKISSRQELGIMFAQVGEDLIARGFLKALDDDLNLAGAKFDIADSKVLGELEESAIPQFLLNALFD